MERHVFLVAVLFAAVSAVATGASGSHLSMSSGSFRVTWTGLEFKDPVFGTSIKCPLTAEGTFHSASIAKTSGSLMGYITRASIGECPGARGTVLSETLPWHVKYEGFEGALPDISSLRLILRYLPIRLEIPLLPPCLMRTENVTLELTGTREAIGLVLTSGTLGSESIACRTGEGSTIMNATYAGSGNVTVLGTTTRITLSLI